jgi:hypothetical protein
LTLQVQDLQFDLSVKNNEINALKYESKQIKCTLSNQRKEIKILTKRKEEQIKNQTKSIETASHDFANNKARIAPGDLKISVSCPDSWSEVVKRIPIKANICVPNATSSTRGPIPKTFTKIIGDDNVRGMGSITQDSNIESVVLTNGVLV